MLDVLTDCSAHNPAAYSSAHTLTNTVAILRPKFGSDRSSDSSAYRRAQRRAHRSTLSCTNSCADFSTHRGANKSANGISLAWPDCSTDPSPYTITDGSSHATANICAYSGAYAFAYSTANTCSKCCAYACAIAIADRTADTVAYTGTYIRCCTEYFISADRHIDTKLH